MGGHQFADEFVEQIDALLEAEDARLVGIVAHGDDDLVEEAARTLQDIEVPVGDRIEGAGKDGQMVCHAAESRGFRARRRKTDRHTCTALA